MWPVHRMQRPLLLDTASRVVPVVRPVCTLTIEVGFRLRPLSHRDGLVPLLEKDATLHKFDLHLEEVWLVAESGYRPSRGRGHSLRGELSLDHHLLCRARATSEVRRSTLVFDDCTDLLLLLSRTGVEAELLLEKVFEVEVLGVDHFVYSSSR